MHRIIGEVEERETLELVELEFSLHFDLIRCSIQ